MVVEGYVMTDFPNPLGNNTFVGTQSADTYHLGKGSGTDFVLERDGSVTAGVIDTLLLDAGLTAADITVIGDIQNRVNPGADPFNPINHFDLVIGVKDAVTHKITDTIRLADQLAETGPRVEQLKLADGA